MKTLYVTVITHKHGNDVIVTATRAAATSKLYGYVCDNWGDGPDRKSVEPPRQKLAAINEYFGEDSSESYDTVKIDGTRIYEQWRREWRNGQR